MISVVISDNSSTRAAIGLDACLKLELPTLQPSRVRDEVHTIGIVGKTQVHRCLTRVAIDHVHGFLDGQRQFRFHTLPCALVQDREDI